MRILVIAPHRDDETLGLGGTMARHAREGHDVVVAIITGHGHGEPHPVFPDKECWARLEREADEAHAVLGVKETIRTDLRVTMLNEEPRWRINRMAQHLLRRVRPEVLYVPFLFDRHQDHREVAEAFAVAWRPCNEEGAEIREVLTYETVSETHWGMPGLEPQFCPNRWVDITTDLQRKIEALSKFTSQVKPFPDARSLEAVSSLARWRGSQVGVHAAEAFMVLRQIV